MSDKITGGNSFDLIGRYAGLENQDQTTEKTTQTNEKPAAQEQAVQNDYVVKPGDTLTKLLNVGAFR